MKNSHSESPATPDTFLTDLRALVTEAEKLLSQSEGEASTAGGLALRERFEAAQERFNELYAGARNRLISGGKYTDKAIRDNPYQSLAIAACVGLLAGVLIGRRAR
jgi:ElaB/YqjD/DUF883 family membrane-anchored ribosome-binding protein